MIFKKMSGIFVCGIISCLLLFACSLVFAEVVDKVIVVVNDEVVTQREFDRIYLPIKRGYESNFKGEELDRQLKAAQEGLMDQLINSKLVISLAKKEKIEVNEDELSERINTIKSYYDSDEAFLQALNDKGTNLTEFEKELEEQMIAQKFVEKEVSSKIIITPGEIRDLYNKNRDQLVAPVRAKTRSITIRKVPGAAEGADRKRAEDVMSELEKGGNFAEIATKYSEGPYAASGGDMGYVLPGQTLEQIDRAIFSLEKGERSDIVESDMGYHIFLVEDVEVSRQLDLSEVSDYLREQLYMQKFQEELKKWLEKKRQNAYISYK